MSNTYSGNPAASARDAIRFEIGDVAAPWQFSDGEIDYVLATGMSLYLMCADLLDALAVRYSARADSETVEDVSANWTGTADRLAKRAAAYRRRATSNAGLNTFGLADGEYEREPYVAIGMFDNPEGTPGRDRIRNPALLGGIIVTP